MVGLCLLVWIFIIGFYSTKCQPLIEYATTNYNTTDILCAGSTQGGTLLRIIGTGFQVDSLSTNPSFTSIHVIQLIDDQSIYSCKIQKDLVTTTQLACYTVPMREGTYKIRILINGNPVPNSQYQHPDAMKFQATRYNTPMISDINAIVKTDTHYQLLNIVGDFKTDCYSQDVSTCLNANRPGIVRVLIGDQVCNLLDPSTNQPYANITENSLQCLFESNQVGLFNVTMLVTNVYGRSIVDDNLVLLSGTGDLYHWDTYATISNISPNYGNREGGTILTIEGNLFSHSKENPIVVMVANRPCIILSVNQTTIRCRTSNMSAINDTYYPGNRGLHLFYENVFYNLSNWILNESFPIPNNSTSRLWIDKASYISANVSNTTVWMEGYLYLPINTTLIFQLDTNVESILYLSTDENPKNIRLIANRTSFESMEINLMGRKFYFLRCIGSQSVGPFHLSIRVKMPKLKQIVSQSDANAFTKQMITLGTTPRHEKQRIVYSANQTTNGIAEKQRIRALSTVFQIGFRGVYTSLLDAYANVTFVQTALNDLPTIYPLSVIVELVQISYQITFPIEMGDVPSLILISPDLTEPENATEIRQGSASGTHFALELDDVSTRFMPFENGQINTDNLISSFKDMFQIRCPLSLNNEAAVSSIVYVNDFETDQLYSGSKTVADVAFCGSNSTINGPLIINNTKEAEFMCFAYKIPDGTNVTMHFAIEIDHDPYFVNHEYIPLSLITDGKWHYQCIRLIDRLEAHDFLYLTVSAFVIISVDVIATQNARFDTVTLRMKLPWGYEFDNIISTNDRSPIGTCVFPFSYRGQNYYTCIVDDQQLPFCGFNGTQKLFCESSSIEGVRRLFPRYQLLKDSLHIMHSSTNQTIDITFRYTQCQSPSIIKTLPPSVATVTSLVNASKPLEGTYDIEYNGQIRRSIPAAITEMDLKNLLQSYSDFGYVMVTRTGECSQYNYTIRWQSPGSQPLITIHNISQVLPRGTPVISTSIKNGTINVTSYPLPADSIVTANKDPQVSVLVQGMLSLCTNCTYLSATSPNVTLYQSQQSNQTVFINGSSNLGHYNQSTEIKIGSKGGFCNITSFSSDTITCTIMNATCSTENIQVFINDFFISLSNLSSRVSISMSIDSIEPKQGPTTGGYPMIIRGYGFGLLTTVLIDGNLCADVEFFNTSMIRCVVPQANSMNTNLVVLSVNHTGCSVTTVTRFIYNSTLILPRIMQINPPVLTVIGGQVNISGSNFGNNSGSVYINGKVVTILSWSNSFIRVNLSGSSPGVYPITVNTIRGWAYPLVHIEYRFNIQYLSSQIGSLIGGSYVTVYGNGFNNQTRIHFRDVANRTFPCDIDFSLSDQIYCRTQSSIPQIVVTANGTDPTYGTGFAWSSPQLIVQRGTNVTWTWSPATLAGTGTYRIQQAADPISTQPILNGFDSGPATASGSFSYQFNVLGIYYYWSPNPIDHATTFTIRGIIEVIPADSQLLTVEAIWNQFTAQSCTFPFQFDGQNYMECTSANDTRLWCSPTLVYTGQRFYCQHHTTNSPTVLNCSAPVLNTSICSEMIAPTISKSIYYVATLCTIESITSVIPQTGPVGTNIIITGTNFSLNACEYKVEIGSIYLCPIMNMTINQIICQISRDSLLDPTVNHKIRIFRQNHGYLIKNRDFDFAIRPAISNISPQKGSIYGGTLVTIEGDGFKVDETMVVIGNTSYSQFINITYSRIIFTTNPENTFIDLNLTILVFVGRHQSICLIPSCSYTFLSSITPYLISVSPSVIRGAANLTFNTLNLLINGGTINDIRITIGQNRCNISAMDNQTLRCFIINMLAGDYPVVGSVNQIGNIGSSLVIQVIAIMSSFYPRSSRIDGGSLLVIFGNGLNSRDTNLTIYVGENICRDAQILITRIICTIPAKGNSPYNSSVFINAIQSVEGSPLCCIQYDAPSAPIVISATPSSTIQYILLNITGLNFVIGNTSVTVGNLNCDVISVTNTSILCLIHPNQSAGDHSIIVSVNFIGDSNRNVSYRHPLRIDNSSVSEGSLAGGLPVTLFGNGFLGKNITTSVCNNACTKITVTSNTELICVTPPVVQQQTTNETCNLTVTVDGISDYIQFTYLTSLTPTITSISPNRGGTGGGTMITITGTNFPSSISTVTIIIDDISCVVQDINTTTITCLTGSSTRTNLQAPVGIFISGYGKAANNLTFQYMNRWSSPWTWGGQYPPSTGSLVTIDKNVTIFLDISTPILKVLVIDGATLIFDSQEPLNLRAEYIILINGGRLQIGSESQPYERQARIQLYGNRRSIELPIFGAKVLAIHNGILDLHGKPKLRTWTRLASTANNGTSIIVLIEAVDWPLNSEIIIATTGNQRSQRESEVRRVKSISSDGHNLTLDQPLTYTHLGINRQVDATTIEMRAEIGLLSHNIVFEGMPSEDVDEILPECQDGFDPDEFATQTCFNSRYGSETESEQFGAILKVNTATRMINMSQTTMIRLSNVEFHNVGQAYLLSRYAIHFEMTGNISMSYMKDSSIHLSFNRALSIQASHGVTLDNNVIYNIMGNAIALEDGVETNNIFQRNLLVFVKSSSSLRNEDLTPAAFWLTNPNNILEGNVVTGCTHYGYWYRLLDQPDQSSRILYSNICPNAQPFGRFINNQVHSTGRYGVWIYPQYASSINDCGKNAVPQIAIFDGLMAWNNHRGMEWVMSRTIQIRNALVFDNNDVGIASISAIYHNEQASSHLRSTFYNLENGSAIMDSIIIGISSSDSSLTIPATAGLIVMWDRGLRIHNVTFINFSNRTRAIYGPATIPSVCISQSSGWLTKFSSLSFIRVHFRGVFRWPNEALYEDEDGTLSGLNHSLLMVPNIINNESSCVIAENFKNAIVCPVSTGPWIRFSFSSWSGMPNLLIITNRNNLSMIINACPLVYSSYTSFTMILQANQTYELSFSGNLDWNFFNYEATAFDVPAGHYLIIKHKSSVVPAWNYARRSNVSLSAVNNHQDWYFDNVSNVYSYMIKNPSNTFAYDDINLWFSVYNRPSPTYSGSNTTATSTLSPITNPRDLTIDQPQCPSMNIRYWSNNSHWTFGPQTYPNWNGNKPGNDVNIKVPRCLRLIIDEQLPRIRSLLIEGEVVFQQGMNHIMKVQAIIINGGTLTAGLPSEPFNGTIDIILQGNNPIDISLPNNYPPVASKMISVFGFLDLRGLPKNISWTRLSISADVNATFLIVRDSIDWNIGDEIIITTTDRDLSHTERHRIVRIENKTIIYIDGSLKYSHKVIQHTFPSGRTIDIAAAVGVVTRNIRIINDPTSTSLSGFRIIVSIYETHVFYPDRNRTYLTYYKGYTRLSNVQLIGFGQFDDTSRSDQLAGIYLNRLGNYDSSRPTWIHSCSFDSGFNTAIAMSNTNGIMIHNNIIYRTYRSGIVITGQNNQILHNLVTTIYWSGTAQPSYIAEYNINYDGAIMTRSAVSVVMRDNLIAGVERLGYRIHGAACDSSRIPISVNNEFTNNEVHSAMSGVNVWPQDRGFTFDRDCVLLKGFTTYKTWYYGFYLNSARNITVDSCTSIDSDVGIFTFIIGPSAVTHVSVKSRVIIQNSIIVGSMTPDDCHDRIDLTSNNIQYSDEAIPTVSWNSSTRQSNGRVGIVFLTVSRFNNIPIRPWTGILHYPCLSGETSLKNSTLAFFNDICHRHDVAIQVSQSNDDGQFPMTTSIIEKMNISQSNIIFNGLPNLEKVNPQDCIDMDCDGLKKGLLIDLDGSLFGYVGTVVSQADANWGSPTHGISDLRIPKAARINRTGHSFNISSIYPKRGIDLANNCFLKNEWGMYYCNGTTGYRMMIIESMDSDSETRRLSPVAILSRSGFIDLLNGPQDHGIQNGYTSQRRLSTFMTLMRSGESYDIYFTGSLPKYIRFRIINADPTFKCIFSLYIGSLQQIDIYANSSYVSPTNRDMNSTDLRLLNQTNGVNISSTSGSNYFDRNTLMVSVAIDGSSTIDLKISPLLILSFNFPPMDPAQFYFGDITNRLALLLDIKSNKIQTVDIISESTPIRGRRQLSPLTLNIQIGDNPRSMSNTPTGIQEEIMTNLASMIINRYQSAELLDAWNVSNITSGYLPTILRIRESLNEDWTNLSIINRTELHIPPSGCREQTPCEIQPVIIAYDSFGNVIQKLGARDRPWQIKATLINDTTVVLFGGIVDYVDGKAQFIQLTLSDIRSYKIQFTLIRPDGVSSQFVQLVDLIVESPWVFVTQAYLDGEHVNSVAPVATNEKFDVSIALVDRFSRQRLGKVRWGNWYWLANITLYSLPKFNQPGQLALLNSSITIDTTEAVIKVANVQINKLGMYILNIHLRSSDGQYSINLRSNRVLVYDSANNFDTTTNAADLSSNITFTGDYDALNDAHAIDITRAMIYNYLLSIYLPLQSDIVLIKGSVVALFQIGTAAENISQAATLMRSNPDNIPNISIVSFNLNGRSSTITQINQSSTIASATSSQTNRDGFNNTNLAIGLVFGLIAVVLLSLGVVVGIRKYRRLKKNEPLERENRPLNGITDAPEQEPSIVPRIPFRNFQLKPLAEAYTSRWARSSSYLADIPSETLPTLDLRISNLDDIGRAPSE